MNQAACGCDWMVLAQGACPHQHRQASRSQSTYCHCDCACHGGGSQAAAALGGFGYHREAANAIDERTIARLKSEMEETLRRVLTEWDAKRFGAPKP